MKKGFVPILILLVVLVLVGVGYFGYKNSQPKSQTLITISPTPAATATQVVTGLKTFTNGKYGFSFQYPARLNAAENTFSETELKADPSLEKLILSWFFRSSESEHGVPLPQDPTKQNEFIANTMVVGFNIYNNPQNLPLKSFIQTLYGEIGIDGKNTTFQIMDRQGFIPTQIPLSGSLLFVGSPAENPNKIYFFSKNGNVYEVTLIGGFGTGEKYSKKAEDEFNQILSTFKFTK